MTVTTTRLLCPFIPCRCRSRCFLANGRTTFTSYGAMGKGPHRKIVSEHVVLVCFSTRTNEPTTAPCRCGVLNVVRLFLISSATSDTASETWTRQTMDSISHLLFVPFPSITLTGSGMKRIVDLSWCSTATTPSSPHVRMIYDHPVACGKCVNTRKGKRAG